MKLLKIYSNKENFKETIFNEGFNVIIGRVSKSSDRGKDTHNLGKTTLIHIIDFLLLKDLTKDHIFHRHKLLFKDYVFFLEILLNNGTCLTIKRKIDQPSKVSLKLHKEKYQNFVNCDNWDYKELGLSSKFPDQNPKKILNRLLEFDVLQDFDYRKTVGYFLRTQEDYNKVFHLSKFAGGDIDWKPFLFELLGFDKTYVLNKYELEKKRYDQEKFIANMQHEFSVNTEEIDKINGIIQIKKEEKEELSLKLDNFDFYTNESNINNTLVEEVEARISELNTLVYKLKFEIEKISLSINKQEITLDLKEIDRVFKDVKLYFPDQLKKEYAELIDFNKRVTAERNKHLYESLQQKELQQSEYTKELREQNSIRTKLLSQLTEKDSFKKYKHYQSDLIDIEKEIERLTYQLENIDVIKNAKDRLKLISDQIDEAANNIQKEVEKENPFYKSIRLMFNQLIKKILKQPGVLSIRINSNGNVEFNAEIVGRNDETTSKGKGHSYKKVLCVCFDLSLLINYKSSSFYRFVYHDGSLESLDDRKKLEYLDLLKSISKEHNIQYILTLIEDDTPIDETGERYLFSPDEIALQLDDRDDNKGRLFELSF